MTRIYLPATIPLLRHAVREGVFQPVGGTGFAVTAGLVAEYPTADSEELEYLAMHDAALASLRLIASGGAPPVRVVLAIDREPAAGDVTDRGDRDRAAVQLAGPARWSSVVAVHLDGGDAADIVTEAARAIGMADLDDPDAAVAVGNAEDTDLGWYAPGEITYLLAELGQR